MPALPLLSSSSGCKTVGRSGEKKESGGNKVFEEKGGARNVEKACLESWSVKVVLNADSY